MQCSEYTGTVLMESYKFMNKSYVNVNSTWTKSEILMYSKYSHSSMFQENYWESEQRLFLGWGYTNERLHFPCSLSCTGEGNGNPLQCSCLENPRDGEPHGLPSMGSHRVGHDWSNLAAAAVAASTLFKKQLQFCLILLQKSHISVNIHLSPFPEPARI